MPNEIMEFHLLAFVVVYEWAPFVWWIVVVSVERVQSEVSVTGLVSACVNPRKKLVIENMSEWTFSNKAQLIPIKNFYGKFLFIAEAH